MTTLTSREFRLPSQDALRKLRHRIAMSPPDHFTVSYVINPWMEGNIARPRVEEAKRQWKMLRALVGQYADVEELPPPAGQPDYVFVANAGLVCGNKFVLSRFRHPERRGEEPHFSQWFAAHDFEVIEMPPEISFEGAGDALFDRGKGPLWMGYGFRTSLDSAAFLSSKLNVEVVPLRLVDERFYHLDTCFCPLSGGYLIYFEDAFDDRSLRQIEERVPESRRFAVSERDALAFACNAIDTGGAVILNAATPELEHVLQRWGFQVCKTPLSEFMLAGGAAKCLSLRLDESRSASDVPVAQSLYTRILELNGHILDTGLLSSALDGVTEAGGSFEVINFRVGVRKDDCSHATIRVGAPDESLLSTIVRRLLANGANLVGEDERPAQLAVCDLNGVAPDGFYSTTIYPTEVLVGGRWLPVKRQRMDTVIVVDEAAQTATCTLIRDLRIGQKVVVGSDGLRITPRREQRDDPSEFKFMGASASSERRVEVAVDAIAWEMSRIRERHGKIVFVAGPVVIHTGGGPYLAKLIRRGYVNALLGGNAIAVHDMEQSIFGTSLGVDLKRGIPVAEGHMHHISVINRVRRAGSIRAAVETGMVRGGVFYELVKARVPFCLAGSIRDDGPLPDTLMNLIEAQAEYARLLEGAEMIVMLSSMLHSIGVGNMTPAGVRLVCVDINTSVATKLADRGSVESTPVVTDVGLFLNLLSRRLDELDS